MTLSTWLYIFIPCTYHKIGCCTGFFVFFSFKQHFLMISMCQIQWARKLKRSNALDSLQYDGRDRTNRKINEQSRLHSRLWKKRREVNRMERERVRIYFTQSCHEGLSGWVPSGQRLEKASKAEVQASETASATVLRKAYM